MLNFSAYGSIEPQAGNVSVIDQRLDTNAGLGSLRLQGNGLVNLNTGKGLPESLASFYKDASALAGQPLYQKLIIVLHRFVVAESNPKNDGNDKTVVIEFTADYFIDSGKGTYRLFGSIDTLVMLKIFSIRKEWLEQNLCSLLGNSYRQLCQMPEHPVLYQYHQVISYDADRKEKLPAYASDPPYNAVFYRWQNFIQLDHDKKDSVFRKSNIFSIIHDRGKKRPSFGHAYEAKVIAIDGTLYFNFDDVFYPMYKKEGDFYFTGKVNDASKGKRIIAGALFGIAGLVAVAVGSPNEIHSYEFKVNYRNGRLMLKRRLVTG